MRGCTHRSQRGFAVLAAAVVIVLIAAAVVTGWATLASVAQANDLDRLQREYLSQVRDNLLAWYRRELAQVDAVSAPPGAQLVLRSAGVTPRWRLQIALSERIERDGVAYRVIALWLPGEADASVLDAATGVFTPSPGARWLLVSGFDLQASAMTETRQRLVEVARRLESGYRLRHLADPSRDVEVNRFRAASCAQARPDDWPCLDTYVVLEASGLVAAAGLDARLLRNAWGAPIEASNLLDSSLVSPHSMALRTVTPWGSTLAAVAVASY
jgi:hypothetical protein